MQTLPAGQPPIEGPLTEPQTTDLRVMRAILTASQALSAAVLAAEYLNLSERRTTR